MKAHIQQKNKLVKISKRTPTKDWFTMAAFIQKGNNCTQQSTPITLTVLFAPGRLGLCRFCGP